jgi:hypothetical protein
VRFRHIEEMPVNCGDECPELHYMRFCATKKCAVNCIVSQWASWSSCSASCGSGQRTRKRETLRMAASGGTCVDALQEDELCKAPRGCPVHCKVSAWGSYGSCVKSCGNSTKVRMRTITKYPANDGMGCPRLSQSAPCNLARCAVDCSLNAWGLWSTCSETCDTGMQFRVRTANPAENGGKVCAGETQACSGHCQEDDCVFTNWVRFRSLFEFRLRCGLMRG